MEEERAKNKVRVHVYLVKHKIDFTQEYILGTERAEWSFEEVIKDALERMNKMFGKDGYSLKSLEWLILEWGLPRTEEYKRGEAE